MLSKKIFSIITIAILLFVCLFGTEASATNIVAMNISNTSGNRASTSNAAGINITSTGGNKNNTANKANNVANNTATESTNKNTNVNNNTANKNTNKSSYNNSNKNASGLPYTGTSDSMLFIVAALILSAVYAYKKIRDYNV